MTVLFQSDFEDTTGQGTLVVPNGMAGWTYDTSSWLVFEASLVSLTAVNGTRVCGRDANLDCGYYTAGGLIGNQAVRHAAKWQSHATPQVIGHLLRRETTTKFYFVYTETDGSSLRVKIVLYQGGSTTLATSSYVLACSVGDVIHHESKIVGTTIESRIWKNGESRPSTATVTVTDSTISTGYPGLIKIGATGYAAADQVVITDGAGGEDYFYPESSGPTTAQPAAGTSLPSTSLTSGLVFARNEADTTASTVLAGSCTLLSSPTDGTAYGTDAQGRYKYYSTGGQYWTVPTYGQEFTVMHIVKHVSNGSNQTISSCEQGPPNVYLVTLDTDGKANGSNFSDANTWVGNTDLTTNAASTSGYSTVVYRVRYASGYWSKVTLDGTSTAEKYFGGGVAANTSSLICLGTRSGGAGSNMTTDRLYFTAVWNRALSDTEITDLSNGWALFDDPAAGSTATLTATTATPTFSGSAQVSPEASITITTASPTFSGGASTGLAEATVTATTASPTFSGSATGDTSQGTLTLPVMKNNTGTVLANETGATVHVYEVSTGNKVVTKTGQTTNGSGVMTVTDALIVAATQYRVVVVLGSGAEGLDKVTAS